LAAFVSLKSKSANYCIGRSYHRLNDDYQPMHALCRFLIEHAGPGTEIGPHESIPFSVDMPILFETFVAESLASYLPDTLKVEAQHHARLDANAELSFRIDLVVRDRVTGRPVSLIDTKYKFAEQPSEEDIKQVVAYGVRLGITKTYLLYPFALPRVVKAKVGIDLGISLLASRTIGREQ
jgi:5-methylcytosine-specific restriction enzyme subunit McrC